MKLVKTKSAAKSYALYNEGAKTAQWQLQSEDGQVLFEVRGRHGAYGTQHYTLFKPGNKTPVASGLTFREVRALAA